MASAKALTQELIREVSRGDLPDITKIRDLLRRGVDINGGTDGTALIWASRFGRKEVVKLLLNGKRVEVNAKDHLGRTALIEACRCCRC